MRHHFTNDGCAHAWANQTSDHGRGSHGSVWFDGSRLYSYGTHFLTAALLPGPLALFNSASYSSTTSGHQSSAKAAASHIRRFTIPDPAEIFDIFESTGINDRLQAEADGKKRPPFRSWPREGETPLAATRRMIRAYVREHAQDLDGLRESLPYRNWHESAQDNQNPRQHEAQEGRLFPVWLLGLVGLGESSWRKILDTDTRRRARLKASAEKMALSSDIRAAKGAADKSESSFLDALARNADLPIPCTTWQIADRVRIVKETATKWRKLHRTAKRNLSAKRTRIIWGRIGIMAAEARRLEVLENRVGLRPRIREAVTALRAGAIPLGATLADWGKALADLDGQAAHVMAHDGKALVFRLGRALEALASEWGTEGLGGGLKAQAAESLAALAPYQESIAQVSKAEAEVTRRKIAQAKMEREAEARRAWQAGESGVRFHGVDELGAAYLRAVDPAQDESGDITGGRLQTSQGAEVPLAEAFRAFRFLKLCRETGQAWEANGQNLRVGHFRIESISAGGDFRALCHFIRWQEVARLAESLGVLGYAADDSAVAIRGAA